MSRLSASAVSTPPVEFDERQPTAVACELRGPVLPDEVTRERALGDGVCLHCGGELAGPAKSTAAPFCCRGCQTVHGLIHEAGLSRYYDLRAGEQSPAAVIRPDGLAWLERLLAEHEERDGPVRLSLDIQGVHCAACIWLLEELFRREPGGLDLRINPALGKVDVVWDPSRGDLHDYVEEVERFGYRLGPSRGPSRSASHDLLLRMATTIALALNVMMFSISYYFGLALEDGALYRVFGVLNLALTTLAVAVGGQVFFQGAIAGLRRQVAHLDLPISVGIALAWAGSVWAYLSHGPEAAYFDTLALFVALMLVGRWAQEHVLDRNRSALLDTGGVDGLVTKRRREGRLESVPATAVETGDELWLAPGDLVPVDGIVLRRPARVSLDWITGESDVEDHPPGDKLPAGAFNAGEKGFALAATQEFSESRLNDLLRGAAGRDSDYRPRWWTWVATAYVAAVLLLAATGFALWAQHDVRRALEVTVAILVVTCPCALGLASPLAQELIHLALRRRGVFLRTADFLDRAIAVRKILLDKTGTLTLGHLVLEPASRRDLWALGDTERAILWNLVVRSNHPVSQALAEALGGAPPPGLFDPAGEGVREIVGRGLEWHRQGRLYRLGKAEFAGDRESSGATVFSVDGRTIVTFRFSEAIKADATGELGRLADAGYEIHLLSGDAPEKVTATGLALGLEASRLHGSLQPEQKAELVRSLDAHDTLMVGDGLNDSPSFEAALCTATPAVDRPALPGKADFYFLGDGIAALRQALASGGRLRRVVRDNLILAALYNLAAVGLCLAGIVTPLVAAVLMPASSVAIVSLTVFRLSGRRLAWMS